MNQGGPISVTWSSLWKIFFMLIFVWVIFVAQDVFLALFLAIVIAAALDRPVTFLEKRKIPRILGTLIIYIVAISIIALVVYSIIPAVITEVNALLTNMRSVSSEFSAFIDSTGLIQELNTGIGRFTRLLFGSTSSILDLSSRFLGGLIFAASVFVLSFYLTVGRDGVEKFLITILPTAYEARALELYARVRRKIARWLDGQLILSLIVGVAVFIGLWLLGVRYSLLLGILAAILELVPYVGPIFSGSIAVLIGVTTSVKLAFYILLLFIIIQQLENHILVPSVMSLTTALNPVVIIVSILIGVRVFGFVGLVLAVPAAVLFQELIESWSEAKHRGATTQKTQ